VQSAASAALAASPETSGLSQELLDLRAEAAALKVMQLKTERERANA